MRLPRSPSLFPLVLMVGILGRPLLSFCPSTITHLRVVTQQGARITQQNGSGIWPLSQSNDDDDDDDEKDFSATADVTSVNVLGTAMECCCSNVRDGIGTGFYRNGYCSTGEQDLGRHTVCVQVTNDFLTYSASVGNDLSTPFPQYMFPGLKDGDIWCLCAQRWAQAYQAGKAPKLFLQATHEKTLDYVPFEVLREYALDKEEADERLGTLNEQREKLKKLLE